LRKTSGMWSGAEREGGRGVKKRSWGVRGLREK
jgi:hypothetical protein